MINPHCNVKHLSSPARVNQWRWLVLPSQATGEQPGWNFYKYLINRNGQVVGTFNSAVLPNSLEISQAIRRALDAHPITKQ